MFTGIIECTGIVESVQQNGGNTDFTVQCPFTRELIIGQSIAHDGVCLTVTSIAGNAFTVTAIHETLQKTNLSSWKTGKKVNLERCMPANGRFDGHIVQGHVDTTATCIQIIDESGSRVFRFDYAHAANHKLVVAKGSVCINGTSLTVVDCDKRGFTVAVIPHTLEITNFGMLGIGDTVNLEFDIVGKYVASMLSDKILQDS